MPNIVKFPIKKLSHSNISPRKPVEGLNVFGLFHTTENIVPLFNKPQPQPSKKFVLKELYALKRNPSGAIENDFFKTLRHDTKLAKTLSNQLQDELEHLLNSTIESPKIKAPSNRFFKQETNRGHKNEASIEEKPNKNTTPIFRR
ncbi:MAG: hypothetical protein AAGG80_02310 [Pseudomonadota bacterium]